ncbi:MAG: RpiB/LacA/LacB family sugar-phosphate isomerase [Clostridia bacterium]|nr:RpiB/LacA/LacB family sugar-phosphate isomerase [Clostridia bacterium]
MKIAVINASSQADKNELLFNTVSRYAAAAEVVNLGCGKFDACRYSYIEISVLVGLLLSSRAADFVVTGCSSGQGMMLACNSMPDVICGYAPTPKDAYLFAQINNGNAISLPLGEEYTWAGEDNLERTVEKLFSEPFGQGYPKSEAQRKLRDTELLKKIRSRSQPKMTELLKTLDKPLLEKALSKRDAVGYILENGRSKELLDWLRMRCIGG